MNPRFVAAKKLMPLPQALPPGAFYGLLMWSKYWRSRQDLNLRPSA